MDNAIYVSLSRQLAVFRDMAATANNIANADTTGYNSEKVMFTDYLVNVGNRNKAAFAQDIASYRDLREGATKVTNNPLDLSISGPGYFSIQTPAGTRYSKAGNFTLDAQGTLVTHAGYPVLDNGGQPIVFESTDQEIRIGENGIITSTTPEGVLEERGQVGVFEFADEQSMTRLSNQLFTTDQEPSEPIASRMSQGTLEGSNVNAITELVRTTELSKSTSGTAKMIEVMYDLQRRTSNTYAKQG